MFYNKTVIKLCIIPANGKYKIGKGFTGKESFMARYFEQNIWFYLTANRKHHFKQATFLP